MYSWKELDAEFRELAPQLGDARLDIQWGSAGVHCSLAGGWDRSARHRFQVLLRVACAKISTEVLQAESWQAEAAGEESSLWGLALRDLSPAFEFGVLGFEKNEDGSDAGVVYSGSVRDPSAASATLCLHLALRKEAGASQHAKSLLGESGAAEHLRKAHAFARADTPDYANSVKEALCALEAVAKRSTGLPSATLGECIAQLRVKQAFHPALLGALDKLWGYGNTSPGARHGSDAVPRANADEAQFVLRVVEAAIDLVLRGAT